MNPDQVIADLTAAVTAAESEYAALKNDFVAARAAAWTPDQLAAIAALTARIKALAPPPTNGPTS